MAPPDATERKVPAFEKSIALKRLVRILRARRPKAARAMRKKWTQKSMIRRQRALIRADKELRETSEEVHILMRSFYRPGLRLDNKEKKEGGWQRNGDPTGAQERAHVG
jgi:hypothetical protein